MIAGLLYLLQYLTLEMHDTLLQTIEAQVWLSDLKRRTQHYGYK